jgi:hypothetical protein
VTDHPASEVLMRSAAHELVKPSCKVVQPPAPGVNELSPELGSTNSIENQSPPFLRRYLAVKILRERPRDT